MSKERQLYMRRYLRERYRKDPSFREKDKRRVRTANRVLKEKVLTHYGKTRKLICTWRNCSISDLDMLSIDHKKDNGADHREKITRGKHRSGGGVNFYRWLKVHKFPKGYRTLCHNHQWKKEILRRKV